MTAPEPGRIRASDAEREHVVSRLRDAMSEGRLTLDEGEERIAAVYAATYRDELPGFTADLPPAEPASDRSHSPRRGTDPPGSDRPGFGGQGWGGQGSGDQGFRGRGFGGHGSGRPGLGRRRAGSAGPPIGLVALLAAVAGTWALVAGGPVWLAIMLGVLTLVLTKRNICHAYRETPR